LVDFVLLQKVAKQQNLQRYLILQGEFLQQLGIITRAKILQKAQQIASEVAQLINFSQMDSLFKVLLWW
jgi:SAM-dependent MidA family methyltransferase